MASLHDELGPPLHTMVIPGADDAQLHPIEQQMLKTFAIWFFQFLIICYKFEIYFILI